MTQVINQITLLTVILTGAALIREREQGTVEHLLVMPVVPAEIMLAKMLANGLVILVAAMLSLQFVVHWWIGSPIAGSLFFSSLARPSTPSWLPPWNPPRHTRDDHGSVRAAGNADSRGDPTAFRRQHPDGKYARLAAICDEDNQSDAAFRHLCAGRAVRGADLTLVWRPLLAMLIIGSVYFAIAMRASGGSFSGADPPWWKQQAAAAR